MSKPSWPEIVVGVVVAAGLILVVVLLFSPASSVEYTIPSDRERIDRLAGAIEDLAVRFGHLPPSDHRKWTGSDNDTNLGIETAFLLLNRRDLGHPVTDFLFGAFTDTDHDQAITLPPWAGNRALFEAMDVQGNPLVYFGPEALESPRVPARVMLADRRIVEVLPGIDPGTRRMPHRPETGV